MTNSRLDDLAVFQYSPLPENASSIRLLSFRASLSTEELELACEAFQMHEAPPYHALSYTWGRKELARTILINGRSMRVGENCWRALRQAAHLQPLQGNGCLSRWRAALSQRTLSVYVWIDAICINQADFEEKNAQVAMMGSIYQQAEKVLASVGAHAEDSAFFFERMPRNHDLYYTSRAPPKGLSAPRLDSYRSEREPFTMRAVGDLWKRTFAPAEGARARASITALAERPYFRRIWIIQELRLAKQVELCCSESHINLEALILMISFMHVPGPTTHFKNRPYITDNRFAALRRITLYGVGQQAELPGLLTNLTHFGKFECSDLHDKIYALLSISKDPQSGEQMRPKYQSSLPELIVASMVHFEPKTWHSGVSRLLEIMHVDVDTEGMPNWLDDRSIRHEQKLENQTSLPRTIGLASWMCRLTERNGILYALGLGAAMQVPDEEHPRSHPIEAPVQAVRRLMTAAAPDNNRRLVHCTGNVVPGDGEPDILVPAFAKAGHYLVNISAHFSEHLLLARDHADGYVEILGHALRNSIDSPGHSPWLQIQPSTLPNEYHMHDLRELQYEVLFDPRDFFVYLCVRKAVRTLEHARLVLRLRVCTRPWSSYLQDSECYLALSEEAT